MVLASFQTLTTSGTAVTRPGDLLASMCCLGALGRTLTIT